MTTLKMTKTLTMLEAVTLLVSLTFVSKHVLVRLASICVDLEAGRITSRYVVGVKNTTGEFRSVKVNICVLILSG